MVNFLSVPHVAYNKGNSYKEMKTTAEAPIFLSSLGYTDVGINLTKESVHRYCIYFLLQMA
jgi:hypothetical protein